MMKRFLSVFLIVMLFTSCREEVEMSSVNPVNWKNRSVGMPLNDSLLQGASYLSVYSQIYSKTEHIVLDLTATISMRNTSRTDTVFIHKAEYFDTRGNSIRTYFNETIYIAPMETVEIIIDEHDKEGGTGANFLFDWAKKRHANAPCFEAVMISTSGQQGLSFTTQGKNLTKDVK